MLLLTLVRIVLAVGVGSVAAVTPSSEIPYVKNTKFLEVVVKIVFFAGSAVHA